MTQNTKIKQENLDITKCSNTEDAPNNNNHKYTVLPIFLYFCYIFLTA